jgi:hypothetical protein
MVLITNSSLLCANYMCIPFLLIINKAFVLKPGCIRDLNRHLYIRAHSSIIHKSQNVETTQYQSRSE